MTKPTISNMLELSTAHLPEELRLALGTEPGVMADELTYGWLLYVPEDIDETIAEQATDPDAKGVPTVVVAICRYADELDCQYVRFDQDEEPIGDLPTFE
jgi:hypothetical protein